MLIEFIKAHTAGIPAGKKVEVSASFGKRMIDSEYAVEIVKPAKAKPTTKAAKVAQPEPDANATAEPAIIEEASPEVKDDNKEADAKEKQ